MAKLSLLLALAQLTVVHGLPARDVRRDALDERAITIDSAIQVTVRLCSIKSISNRDFILHSATSIRDDRYLHSY
jgi:hypothetical protein